MNSTLTQYMREIGGTPLLTAAEEISLAKRIASGDETAHSHLVKASLRLVVSIAKSYRKSPLDFEDLISEGNLGLIRAARLYAAEHDTRFSTYATYWVNQAIRWAILSQGSHIRVPMHIHEYRSKIRNGRAKLSDLPKNCQALVIAASEVLDKGISGGDAVDWVVKQGDNRDHHPHIPEYSVIKPIVDSLPVRLRTVLMLRFGLDGSEPHTLEAIAKKNKVTREAVRQVEERAIEKLRMRTLSIKEKYAC